MIFSVITELSMIDNAIAFERFPRNQSVCVLILIYVQGHDSS